MPPRPGDFNQISDHDVVEHILSINTNRSLTNTRFKLAGSDFCAMSALRHHLRRQVNRQKRSQGDRGTFQV